MYRSKFRNEYGELVIACDNGRNNYWRKQVFPYYKANRKKSQASSELDWKTIFDTLNKIKTELKENFPFRVVDVESTEADDIIGTLCSVYGNTNENILIVSGDKDFQQLQKYSNVKQFNPTLKKYVVCDNPKRFLQEHILRGDTGDGIPNILSEDNCFVVGSRQKPLTTKKLSTLIEYNLDGKIDDSNYRNYMRNKQLIDLTQIPENIKKNILDAFEQESHKERRDLMKYFVTHRLRNLMEDIGDFT